MERELTPIFDVNMVTDVGATHELSCAMLSSMQKIVDDGSVLHMCVRCNHLEALKFLVQCVRGAQELLHAKDKDGNTVLHLAVRLRQIQVQFSSSL